MKAEKSSRQADGLGPSLDEARLRRVFDATTGLHRARSLAGLLQEVVESATSLVGAKYGALGVIDPAGQRLEQFITTGVDDATHRTIGELPQGRGLLGALIREAKPLRLRDMSEDPRSVGFPAGHPPMRSFLGVPVRLRGRSFGNLYLTEKEEGEFTDADREVVELLATQAAIAIENARLYDSARRWARQLDSLNEIAAALVGELELPRLLEVIADRLRELLDARVVLMELRMSNGRVRVEGVSGDERARGLMGMRSPQGAKSHHVLARKRSERVDSALEDPEMDPEGAALLLEAQALLLVPLIVRGEAIGVITVADKEGRDPRFSDEDLRLAEAFAARAAAAVELTRRVSRDTVRSILQAQETERARLSRELHDQTGQALAALKLGLGRTRRAQTLEAARDSLGELDQLLGEALTDLRTIAVELRPAALDEFGLVAALERLGRLIRDSHPIAVQLVATLEEGERLPDEIETALYRIVQEALSNVVKHAEASRVHIAIIRRDQLVIATIEDDGRGFDPLRVSPDRLGLTGIRERAAIFNGRALVESIPGRGSTITAELPLTL